MTDLKKIREEWGRRPLSPDVSKAIGKPEDSIILSPAICEEPNCEKEVFRSLPKCRRCHLLWIQTRELEREELQQKKLKREKSKGYAEEKAMNAAKAATSHCARCGCFLPYSEKKAVLKPEGRRPKKPVLAKDKYEVRCRDCAKSK